MSKSNKSTKQKSSIQPPPESNLPNDQSQTLDDAIDSDALFQKWAAEDALHSRQNSDQNNDSMTIAPKRFSVANQPLALIIVIVVSIYLSIQSFPAFKAVLEADQYEECGDVSFRPEIKDTRPNELIQWRHQQKCKLKGVAQGMNLYAVGRPENPESKDPFESKKGLHYVVKLVGDRVFAILPAHEVWVEGFRLKTDSLLGLEIDQKGIMVSPKQDRMYEKLGQQLRESFQIPENEEIFFFDTAYNPWQNKLLIFTFIFSPFIIILALIALFRVLKTKKLERELEMLIAKSQNLLVLTYLLIASMIFGMIQPKIAFAQSHNTQTIELSGSTKNNDLEQLKLERPLIWTLEHPKNPNQKSYLIGTIHIPHPFFQPLPSVFKAVIDDCSAFYAELDLSDKQSLAMQMMTKAMMTNGETLSTLLKPNHKKLLDDYLQSKALPSAAFETMHPAFVEIMLLALELQSLLSKGSALDELLVNYAKSKAKITGGIETPDEQINALLSDPPKIAADSLGFSLDRLQKDKNAGKNSIEELIKAYFSGDPKKVQTVSEKEIAQSPANQKNKFKKMLDDRNLVMTNRIIDYLDKDPKASYCFAFGSAHFVSGKQNIIALLKKKGYKIQQISNENNLK
jgi:uncharacterized protein YbaP (TraB family)